MSIIERITQIMDTKNLNQSDLCKILGIKDSTFSTWKTRGTDPPAKYILLICEYLGVSVDYLLGRTDNKNGYNNNTIVNNGNTTINDSGIQANVVNNQPQQIQFDSTTIQVAEVFQSLNFTDKAKVISLLAELSQKGV